MGHLMILNCLTLQAKIILQAAHCVSSQNIPGKVLAGKSQNHCVNTAKVETIEFQAQEQYVRLYHIPL